MNSLSDYAAKIDARLVYTAETSFQHLWFQTTAMEAESRQPRGRNVALDFPTRIFAAIRRWPGVSELEKELLDDGKVWCSAHLLEWAKKRAKHLGMELGEFRKMQLEKALAVDRSIEKAIVAARAWCKDVGPNRPVASQADFVTALLKKPEEGMLPHEIAKELGVRWGETSEDNKNYAEKACARRARPINKKQLGFSVRPIDCAWRIMPPIRGRKKAKAGRKKT